MKDFIKNSMLTKKQYIVLTLLILLVTCLEVAYPIRQDTNFYTYKFGFLYSWLLCFNNADLGGMTLFQCIRSKSSLGVSVYPQNIIISIIFINAIIAFLRWITREKER